MKKSNNFIVIAILVIVAFWGFVFIVGSDNDIDMENSTTQTTSVSDNLITTTNNESTTEASTEESTTRHETTTEENTTEEESTTQNVETTTKKKETTTKKAETTTKKTETTTKKVTTTVDPDSQILVYYTKTGEKYHYENPCGRGTYYPCTLEEAKEKGLEPCEKCVLH